MAVVGHHPVIDIQSAMTNGPPVQSRSPGGIMDDDGLDLRVPRCVGGIVLGSLALLLFLRLSGFRFSFGAGMGG